MTVYLILVCFSLVMVEITRGHGWLFKNIILSNVNFIVEKTNEIILFGKVYEEYIPGSGHRLGLFHYM